MSVKPLATVYMAELQAPAREGTFIFASMFTISMQFTQLATKVCGFFFFFWGGGGR
jgi:hypothetical protein